MVVAVDDAAQGSIAFARIRIAAESAVDTNRGGKLLVPFAGVMVLEGLIGEHPGWTDFNQVAAEFIFENPVLVSAEKDPVSRREGIQIVAARVVPIVAHAAVALDAPVHLVIHQGPQILIAKGAFLERVTAVVVTRHHGHVLQVTFATLIANGAVVRMVQHESFDNASAEGDNLWISD